MSNIVDIESHVIEITPIPKIVTPASLDNPTSSDAVALQKVGASPESPKSTAPKKKPTLVEFVPPTEEEKKRLAELEADFESTQTESKESFFKRAKIFHEIVEGKLYRGTHSSAAAYFKAKWNYARSHAYRLAEAGAMIKELSPSGDIVKKLTSESHFRPLTKLDVAPRAEAIGLLALWAKWTSTPVISPRMVESAAILVNPPATPRDADRRKSSAWKNFEKAVSDLKSKLPKDTPKEAHTIITEIVKKAEALNGPMRTTGIDWTDSTWNPLQGCSRASAGCDNCYAAKLVATRLADVYPGLAVEKVGKDGKKTYSFTGKIMLLPEQLGEPLKNREPRRYFVNSMSDLFHKNVPDEFIHAVFDVMEKAHWHQFQVLTKRPERMAEFTSKRYADKALPANVWLGTTTEDQKAFDERYPHLMKVKAAVRWLSVEPMIGKITPTSLDGIDWVVVGGESGSKRRMERSWVVGIRDACEKAEVPFFFKQWGEFGEDGKKLKKIKKDGLTPSATLDGKTYAEYPIPEVSGNPTKIASHQNIEPTKAA